MMAAPLLPLERLLVDLATAMLCDAGDPHGEVSVREARLDLPLEARLASGGEVAASLPRWRLATGFEPVLSRLGLRVVEEEPATEPGSSWNRGEEAP
jgi:hypothetical protein